MRDPDALYDFSLKMLRGQIPVRPAHARFAEIPCIREEPGIDSPHEHNEADVKHNMWGTIHILIDGKTPCGVNTKGDVQTVPPKMAKFVTCKRCLASLRKVTG